MFKKITANFHLNLGLVVLFLLLAESSAFAQQLVEKEKPFFTSDILQVYFLMLIFATIINRILEYLKLLTAAVEQKVKFLYRIGNSVWSRVQLSMDRLGIYYDAKKTKRLLQKYLIFAVMQFFGFVLGVLFAWVLQLNVLSRLELTLPESFGYIITGLVIGAGVEPVHSFFRIAQEKRKIKELLSKIKD